jgi:hypothetical protein
MRLLNELEERTAEGDEVRQLLAEQESEPHLEELLGRLIGVKHLTVRADHDQRERKTRCDRSAYESIRFG